MTTTVHGATSSNIATFYTYYYFIIYFYNLFYWSHSRELELEQLGGGRVDIEDLCNSYPHFISELGPGGRQRTNR